MSKGVTTGMRTNADSGGDTYFSGGFLQDFADIHVGQQLSTLAEKQVVLLYDAVSKVPFPRTKIADQLLAEIS